MAMSRIVVAFGGSEQWDITGERDDMWSRYADLRDVLQQVDGIHPPFYELDGFRNLADRKNESFIVRLADIKGVDIQET
jgi:hypothetical protein